jgi:hypothetical protein
MPLKPVYDRALLLLGPKRNKVLTLEEVRQYGVDSFSDPDYVKIYGMASAAWYRQGIACEFDRQVYELTKRNIAGLDRTIDLQHGDYQSFLTECRLSSNHGLIFFIAPPRGTALDEVAGLDLRCTTPPITDIIGFIKTTYPRQRVLVAIQVYEKLNPSSLPEVQAPLDWSDLLIYDLNEAGKNHGILLGTSGWKPSY